jgi:hypothetical protein
MEVFILVVVVAFIFYIKIALDSKFNQIESNIEDKIDRKFKELFKKIDDLKETG